MAVCVLDASMAAAWWLPDESTAYTKAVLESVAISSGLAPRLWAYEIRNIVLMAKRRNRITSAEVDETLAYIRSLRLTLIDPPSYDGILALATDHALTFYDAAYLDLAIRESLPLASLDRQLNEAAGKAGVTLFKP